MGERGEERQDQSVCRGGGFRGKEEINSVLKVFYYVRCLYLQRLEITFKGLILFINYCIDPSEQFLNKPGHCLFIPCINIY